MNDEKDLNLEIMNLMLSMRKRMTHFGYAADDKQISMVQLQILHLIQMHEGIKMTDLANQLKITGASTTSHIDALEKLKLVQRKTSADDRRSFEVYLTFRGKFLFKKMEHLRKHHMHRLLDKLDNQDKQHLISILEKIINSY